MVRLSGEQNPFLRYRDRLDSYRAVADGRLTDAAFVDLVGSLDDRVREVAGRGFAITPIIDGGPLVAEAGLAIGLTIKVEVDNVGGSHKARHLFGTALHLLIAEEAGAAPPDRLAIASCGNAALGAGIVARAMGRELDVFVPTWADSGIVAELEDLGATVSRCERREGEVGDPAYLRFREAVLAGAQPFSVQGTDTATTFDGGRTLGWELAEQRPGVESIYVQVGGGALATSVSLGVPDARLHPVQTEGCAPLAAAWDRLHPDFDFDLAEAHPGDFMQPWPDEPHSVATGILDDVTYDWLPLLRRTRASGGRPIVVPEAIVIAAHEQARRVTGVPVSPTGTAGFAGLLTDPPAVGQSVAVLFTGIER